jgi:peptidoglycan/LPS O-acetylase OafA/YrhL
MDTKAGYIPTLDGWRALAMTVVCVAHLQVLPLPGFWGRKLAIALWVHGALGVEVFFAISGLLICSRLLDEESRYGRISIRNFYIRRAFRILPPALLFLLTIAGLHILGLIQVSRLDWFSSLFFFRNYTVTLYGEPLSWWFTSHFWSLSVEEHFYLILPAILVFVPRFRARALLLLALVSLAWKLYIVHLPLDPMTAYVWLHYHTDGCIDALLIPAALTIWLREHPLPNRLKSGLIFLTPVLAWAFFRFSLWPLGKLAAPLLILATVYRPRSFVGRFLESSPMRWVGRLSYSLYLWQILFFCTRLTTTLPLGRIQAFPYNIVALFACACFSHYFVERPMIRIEHSLASS